MKVAILVVTAVVVAAWALPASAGLLGILDPILNPHPAPEIDPASARAALALLVGGGLILRDRLRRG